MGLTFFGTFFCQKQGKNNGAAQKKTSAFFKSTKTGFTVLLLFIRVTRTSLVNFSLISCLHQNRRPHQITRHYKSGKMLCRSTSVVSLLKYNI